jgi:DNA-binding IclR family transcriptional regulator
MGSVDRALQILVLLGERKQVRVMEVADHLGVARSTAHRLLTALLHREFVVQDANKVYHRGPAFANAGFGTEGICLIRAAVRPRLEALSAQVSETCHLVVLEGNGARFIDGVESGQILRVRPRTGMLLSAHSTAAGKALLAELSPRDFFALYPLGLPGATAEMAKRRALQDELAIVRQRGFATNFEETERGVTAVATVLKDPGGRAVASIAIACPSARCPRSRVDTLAEVLRDVATAAGQDLASVETTDSPRQNPHIAAL